MRRRLWLALLALVVLVPLALAQPYAADGGFGRPVQEESSSIAASVGVAVSPAGTVTTVWAGPEGVWRLDRTAAGRSQPQLVTATDDVRSLSAAYVGDELVLTWISRDRSTGIYHYLALLEGELRELFQDSLIVDLHLFTYQGAPHAAGLFRRGGQGQIVLFDLAAGVERVLYRTSLTQRGLDVLALPDGRLWLGWLEGRNEQGEFGLISEWDAFVGLVPAPGSSMLEPVGLGEAYVEDERMAVALLSQASDGSATTVWALWADEEADLRLSEVMQRDGQLSAVATSQPVGRGRPIGAAWPHLYWVTNASIVRQSVDEPHAQNVVWSPITIEGVAFTSAAPVSGGANDLTAVAWYGRAQGGSIQIYSADDRVPMVRTFTDRLAAFMNWNPWHMWDELIGQALTALLIGVMVGIALVPILMIFAQILGKLVSRPRAALVSGLVMGLLPLALGVYLYLRAFGADTDPNVTSVASLFALVLGPLAGWLVSRRGDREAQGTFTVVGAVTAFVGATLFAFITYTQWAPLVGLT